MKVRSILILLLVLRVPLIDAAQIIAGSQEDKALRQFTAESDPDRKITLGTNFEKAFPQSRALTDVYVLLSEVYRQKKDRVKSIEYCEKTLNLEPTNITALMSVARSYAMLGQHLDRAAEYAQRAVDLTAKMRSQAAPSQYTEVQWSEYVKTNEQAAQGILQYVKTVGPR